MTGQHPRGMIDYPRKDVEPTMEWVPGNPEFELAGNANVEWYDPKYPDKEAPDYHSAVWIPVKRK